MSTHTAADLYRDEFFAAYIECALWSSTDMDTERPLDDDYDRDDIAPDTLSAMRLVCDAFISGDENGDLDGIDPGQAGHDFWLTRNGHGAGFWDRGLGEVGDRLTAASKAWGSVDLYVGDDGRIHGEN